MKWTALLGVLLASANAVQPSGDIREETQAIRAVGLEGSGNGDAGRAWRSLASSNAADLPAILAAMDGANDLAVNWLRMAAESIMDRELASGHPVPLAALTQFLGDTRHHPRARRLAFELIALADPGAADRLVGGMVDDPSPELRRDAVQKRIDAATRSLTGDNKTRATLLFEQALAFARDVDQVEGITTQLRALGQPVDLPRVFGFIMQWKVIGPFDSTGGKGFTAAFPPEQSIDLDGEVEGKSGKVRWVDLVTTNELGVLSMNKPFGPLKAAAAYALAEFYSNEPRSVELRLGSENAWKLWLNGKILFGQNEYHRNKAMDQFVMQGELQKGRNLILVKVCQNEQTEDWAGDWDFQLRVCDALGTPIRSSAELVQGGKR